MTTPKTLGLALMLTAGCSNGGSDTAGTAADASTTSTTTATRSRSTARARSSWSARPA